MALPPEVAGVLDQFDRALTAIEERVSPYLEKPFKDSIAEMDAIETSKLNLAYSYTMNSLYYMFLKVHGVSPQGHPVRAELDRVKKYMAKTLATENEVHAARKSEQAAAGGPESEPAEGSDRPTATSPASKARKSNGTTDEAEERPEEPPSATPAKAPGSSGKKRKKATTGKKKKKAKAT
eukprot:CAMPEP_0202038376 /NCGR_PEP_ID=MMETSP0962-20130828/9097_1 /ASSEMBLY_ACC=CAM_ASM_000488 /TAXON_ID=4773 /ORGANISM="Schizochytrium aggregatum, Strain ATCC28209" /LENGTH=179 /DNA_ID=CAMNT_0048602531 /DNA_START=14 /DNA_END=553 /DNA_ORIENTATION=+